MTQLLKLQIPAAIKYSRQHDVVSFGAVEGGRTLNTEAFRRGIAACAHAGETLRIPSGDWLTGPIHLKSHVHLHLEKGARIIFSTGFEDYLPVVFTRWEGVECYNYSALIYAQGCSDISITGEGEFDGQGSYWWSWALRQSALQKELFLAGRDGVPVQDRVFGTERAAFRPPFFQPINCRNVLVEGVTFRNGPMWTLHPVYCDNVIIRGVTVVTEGPNTDGLNPDSCRGVLVENCLFATGDDCIAINAGKNEDAWRVGRPCEDIEIRHCRMERGHAGVAIGSGMSGGVRNVVVHDCTIQGTQRGIRLKSTRGRGGVVEDICFRDIQMAGVEQAIVADLFYNDPTVPARRDAPPIFRRIELKNIQCDGANTGLLLRGLPEQPIEDLCLEQIHIRARNGWTCQDVTRLIVKDMTLSEM